MKRRDILAAGAAVAATAVAPTLARAATPFPSKPVKIMQGYAVGGNADTISRVVGAEMAKALGQSVLVESLTGAGGTIAASSVARAEPDGYTLLCALGGHAIAAAMMDKVPYRAVADFEMVSMITSFPMLIVTRPDSPYQTFEQVLAASRARPGQIAYGSAGIGTGHHLGGELLASMAGVQWLHVPYRGDAASMTAVLGGEVPIVFIPPTAVVSNIQAGKLKALAVTGGTRWAGMPDVRTVAEQGVAGYDVRSWAGLMAPARTPAPVIEKLNAAVLAALATPAVKTKLEEMGGDVKGSTPAEMRAIVDSEVKRWTQVVQTARIAKT